MKTTTQIYTDIGQLGIDSMVSKLPSLTATNTATKGAENATKTGKNEVIKKLAQMLNLEAIAP